MGFGETGTFLEVVGLLEDVCCVDCLGYGLDVGF